MYGEFIVDTIQEGLDKINQYEGQYTLQQIIYSPVEHMYHIVFDTDFLYSEDDDDWEDYDSFDEDEEDEDDYE